MNAQQDDEASNMNTNPADGLSVGVTLREAREQLGLSVNDVSNRIKFSSKQIEWLEADDFVRLPEATIVRGFVRSYARLLKLDSVAVLSGLPSSYLQTSSAHEIKSVEIPMPSAFAARKHNIIWLAAALLVALSLAIFERMHNSTPEMTEAIIKSTVQPLELPSGTAEIAPAQLAEQPNDAILAPVTELQQAASPEPAPLQPVIEKIVPVAHLPATKQQTQLPTTQPLKQAAKQPDPQPVQQPIKREDRNPLTPVAKQPEPQLEKQAEKLPEQQALKQSEKQEAPQAETAQRTLLQRLFSWGSVPATPAKETQQAEPQQVVSVAPAPAPIADDRHSKVISDNHATEHSLRLEFDENAWLEIKDGNDKVLVSRLHTAGSLVRLTGKAPLLVVIGNAHAVRLFDNGKKIKLEQYTTAGVARVTLK